MAICTASETNRKRRSVPQAKLSAISSIESERFSMIGTIVGTCTCNNHDLYVLKHLSKKCELLERTTATVIADSE